LRGSILLVKRLAASRVASRIAEIVDITFLQSLGSASQPRGARLGPNLRPIPLPPTLPAPAWFHTRPELRVYATHIRVAGGTIACHRPTTPPDGETASRMPVPGFRTEYGVTAKQSCQKVFAGEGLERDITPPSLSQTVSFTAAYFELG
jgi:hypothetical protein